jgi:NAD(P)-dependent dehydrogenase (short-subunit alcohol dehydrogenase family)
VVNTSFESGGTVKKIDLKNKTAVVTGARRGIGMSIALALAEAGADVAVCDIVGDDGQLDKVVGEIKAMERRSLGYTLDVSKRSEVDATIQKASASFGHIDILVNCAGVWTPGQSLLNCTEETWDRVMEPNLKGTFFCCVAAARHMASQRSGNIINLSSQVGINPGTSVGAYSISKAGVIMLTKQLALELAPFGVRVNALAPGVVKTEFTRGLWTDTAKVAEMSAMIPIGRMGEAEEIAWPAVFLASAESSYITGAVIGVDGGWQVPVTDRVGSTYGPK